MDKPQLNLSSPAKDILRDIYLSTSKSIIWDYPLFSIDSFIYEFRLKNNIWKRMNETIYWPTIEKSLNELLHINFLEKGEFSFFYITQSGADYIKDNLISSFTFQHELALELDYCSNQRPAIITYLTHNYKEFRDIAKIIVDLNNNKIKENPFSLIGKNKNLEITKFIKQC